MKHLATSLVVFALIVYIGLWLASPQVAPKPTDHPPVAQVPKQQSIAEIPNDTPTHTTASIHDDAHSEKHAHSNSSLPPELEQYVETQRLPAEKIPLLLHGSGNATAYSGNQWSTVVMAVIDDDGSHRTVERKILPIGALTIPLQEAK